MGGQASHAVYRSDSLAYYIHHTYIYHIASYACLAPPIGITAFQPIPCSAVLIFPFSVPEKRRD